MNEGSRRPAILFVTLWLERGGTEGHLVEVAKRLHARGWPVSIYCLYGRGALAGTAEAAGVEVVTPPSAVLHAKGLPLVLGYPLAAPHLLWTILSKRASIAHFFLPAAYILGAPVAIVSRVPVKIMSRRSLANYSKGRKVIQASERWLHRRMTALTGNSKSVVRELVGNEGADPARTGLIYNGVALDRFAAAAAKQVTREKLGISADAFVFVTVANLIPYKGHADLIEALAAIKPKLPNPWVLLCAGRDDGIGPDLSAMAARYGLDRNIKFLGSRADVPDILKCADAGILCSHEEGFSNAVLEGMAAGLPMVVTDVGGNAEAVRDGIDGFVVPPCDPLALANAILTLATDPAKARTIGAEGCKRVEAHFSIDACIGNYEQFYTGLAAGELANQIVPHS